MGGFIKGFLSNITDVYNRINPLTFGGSNDIIVIKHKDGTYKCTPFQLRFSKIQFYDCRSHTVNIFINGKKNDITMKITKEGDLYFESNEDVTLIRDDKIDIDQVIQNILKMDYFFIKKGISQEDGEKIISGEEKYEWIDIEIFEKIREKNLEMRGFGKRSIKVSESTGFPINKNKFSNVLGTDIYWEYLLKNCQDLYFTLESLYFKQSTPELATKIEFSNCLQQKVNDDDYHGVFDSFTTTEIFNNENLVVRIKNGRYVFYFTYNNFNKIFWELRGSSGNSKNKIMKLILILEKYHEESKGWSFFGKPKLTNKNVSFTLTPSSKELEALDLVEGEKNEAIFKIVGSDKQLTCGIYCWNEDTKIFVSDVDGTITKSDILGHIYGYIGMDYTHKDIVALYNNIVNNGYRIIYLSSRPLGQSEITRLYLENVNQNNLKLPDGPLLLNFDGMVEALLKEVIYKTSAEFKKSVLTNILSLFPTNTGKKSNEIFVGGFGNKISDLTAYSSIGISENRIFLIDEHSNVQIKSSKCTYNSLTHLVDTMFPNLKQVLLKKEFTDYSIYNYWTL